MENYPNNSVGLHRHNIGLQREILHCLRTRRLRAYPIIWSTKCRGVSHQMWISPFQGGIQGGRGFNPPWIFLLFNCQCKSHGLAFLRTLPPPPPLEEFLPRTPPPPQRIHRSASAKKKTKKVDPPPRYCPGCCCSRCQRGRPIS